MDKIIDVELFGKDKRMNKKFFLVKLQKIVVLFEILVSVLLVLGIVFSLPSIMQYYKEILNCNGAYFSESLPLFKQFLSHMLLLVIAMEFVLLMAAHNDATVTHLILLVVARKMLIVSENMSDLLMGVIAIVLIFATNKYLVSHAAPPSDLIFDGKTSLFSASVTIEELNGEFGFQMEDRNCVTLGGLVATLVEADGKAIEEGVIVDDKRYIYELKRVQNGVIEAISIHHV